MIRHGEGASEQGAGSRDRLKCGERGRQDKSSRNSLFVERETAFLKEDDGKQKM